MTRRDFEKKSWIPITRRLPPDDREKYLAWNSSSKEVFIEFGYILHNHAKILVALGDDVEAIWAKFASDRIFSYWKPIIGPKG